MAKELLLYGSIESQSSSTFINLLEENADQDISVRINSDGGSPEYGWGMIAKFSEHKGAKSIKVDGRAHSMALYFLCYAEDVEALDVSQFCLHRAAYPSWIESNPDYFTQAMRENLDKVNAGLKKALEAKIDVAKLEEIKGIKMKDVFSMDSRIDVLITSKEAKQIGLINKITRITPQKKAEIESMMFDITAKQSGFKIEAVAEEEIESNPKINKMTIEKLKAEHPEVYNQIIAAGVAKEKDRVEACLVFNEIDPAGVKAAIESGNPISHKQMAEFALKAASANILKKTEEKSAKAIKTAETGAVKSEKEKALEAFEAEVDGKK